MPKEIETKKTKTRGLIEKPKRYQTSDSDDNPFIKKRKNKVQNILADMTNFESKMNGSILEKSTIDDMSKNDEGSTEEEGEEEEGEEEEERDEVV